MSSLDENILTRYHSFIYIKPSALVCIHTQKENDASKRYQLSIFPLIIILLGLTVILCQILYITWVFSIYGVGEWLLFNAKRAIFQIYYDESKLNVDDDDDDDDDLRFELLQHTSLYSASSLKQQFAAGRHDVPLGFLTHQCLLWLLNIRKTFHSHSVHYFVWYFLLKNNHGIKFYLTYHIPKSSDMILHKH